MHIVRFNEALLSDITKNSFEARGKNAWGYFDNVVCHFHQSTTSLFD